MKKLIKRKLSIDNGYTKNFFLWEISGDYGTEFEIVEEFKGKSIARAILRGLFRDKISALHAFNKVIDLETQTRKAPVHHLVFQ